MIQKFNPFIRNDYPTSDGRPRAETDWHRDLMLQLIETLKAHYAADPDTYVSGNLLIFYKPNDRRRHVSPDVFVAHGVRDGFRPNYLVWQEGKGPDVVIELTSKTTRREDITTKMALYRDTLKVKEYFLFDPLEEYLDPSMLGYRLVGGEYRPIREKGGRLPSRVLGLHLERDGHELRLWNPATGAWIPTADEIAAEAVERAEEQAQRAEEQAQRAEEQAQRAEEQAQRAEEQAQRAEAAEAEVARLRQLLADRGHGKNGR